MPRQAKELSALTVSRLRAEGRHAVGGVKGLHLRIAGASRAWVLRLQIGERRCDLGLGPFPEVTLADAREAALDLRRQVRRGLDPIADRQQRKSERQTQARPALTFKACAEAFVELHSPSWKNSKHISQWSSTLARYVYPRIGNLPVSEVETQAVLEILKPIWSTKTETANRVRSRIRSILDWAKVQGFREGDNPAAWQGHLDKLLPPPRRVTKVEHHAALPYADAANFIRALQTRSGSSARALEFSILCAARSGEVRDAKWHEMDLHLGLWTIPGSRMKAGKEHRVPLAPEAIGLLNALPRFKGDVHVFASPKGQALSDMSLTAVIRRLGYPEVTQHGFRSTFRDWAGETTAYPREVIEHALAHQLKDKTEAAYQRGDLLTKRRALMIDWATFCYAVPA